MSSFFSRKSHRPALNSVVRDIFCALAAGSLLASGSDALADQEFVPGQIIVHPLPGLSPGQFKKILGGFGGKSARHLHQIDTHVVSVPAGREDEFVELFSRHPHVAFAEKDFIVEHSAVPNDPIYPYEWHLQQIQAPAAWEQTPGNSAVIVAVLDSGVDAAHVDLAGKLVSGWNVVSNTGDTTPITGHGTWVAGVIAGATNNGVGVASVGWNTLVQPVRVTNDPTGSAAWSDLADGIIWAADHGAKIANISYDMGWYCGHTTLDSAAQYFRSKGGVVVAAAGNDSTNETCAADPYLIIVSATDRATDGTDVLATFSNYGSFIDIAAPGVGIYTTASGGDYSYVTGTSFSSPITAGVVALMMAANPNLTPDQYESLLTQSADNVGGGARPNPYFGWGRVNAASAVLGAAQYVPSDTTPPTTAVVSPTSGTTVAGTQVVRVSAQDNVNVAKVQFYANNQLVGESTVGPSHQFSWDTATVADGNVPVYSYAYDSAGNRGASAVNTVTVNNHPVVADTTPPTIAVTSPANNSKVSGTVLITVKASDNVALKQVQILIDGKPVTTSTTSPLTYAWNTRSAKSGTHSIKGIATDTSDLTSQSAITVRK